MIQIFKTTKSGLREIGEFQPDCWVNVSQPSKEELDNLAAELCVPQNFLTSALDVDERSRIEIDDNWTLILIRVPRCHKCSDDNVPYSTLPLSIILNSELIITICNDKNQVLNDFINGKVKKFSTESRSRFVLQILYKTSLFYLNCLREINKSSTAIEKELHRSSKNEKLIKLLDLEKSLVFFTTSLKSNELVLERLHKTGILNIGKEDEEFFEDVIIENKQAIEMANIYSNILSGLMDAFASVIQNNVNAVMKLLTAITLILMIPNLIASIYGMNVELPLQHSEHAFLIVVGVSAILSLGGIVYFIKKGWF